MRAIGFVFMLMSAVLFGFTLQKRAVERIEFLRFCVLAVRHAERKIDLFATPTGQLFQDLESDCCYKLQKGLRDGGVEGFKHLLIRIGPDEQQLLGFLDEVGRAYKEDAVRVCRQYSAQFEERLISAKKEYDGKKKLYFALPMLIAVSVFVLLL